MEQLVTEDFQLKRHVFWNPAQKKSLESGVQMFYFSRPDPCESTNAGVILQLSMAAIPKQFGFQ